MNLIVCASAKDVLLAVCLPEADKRRRIRGVSTLAKDERFLGEEKCEEKREENTISTVQEALQKLKQMGVRWTPFVAFVGYYYQIGRNPMPKSSFSFFWQTLQTPST